MQSDLLSWLAGASSWAFSTALTLFLVVNALAVAVVLVRRDRALVDRWTPKWLAANIAILGLGAGVPLVTSLLRAGISLLPHFGSTVAATPK